MKQKATKVRIVYFNGFGRFTALTLRGADFLGCQQWSREYHLWRRACASGHLRRVQSLRVVFPLRNTISIRMFRYVSICSNVFQAHKGIRAGDAWPGLRFHWNSSHAKDVLKSLAKYECLDCTTRNAMQTRHVHFVWMSGLGSISTKNA